MGSLPVSAHRGRVPWQGLLLAVSLLTFWSLPTTAQFIVVPKNAAEGSDVLLRIYNKPPNITRVVWYRGASTDQTHIIAFLTQSSKAHYRGPTEGSVTINDDGFLLLKNVTMNDTGIYTVLVRQQDSKKLTGFGRLNVHEPVKVPTLVASSTTVTEDKDAVVLTCYTDARSTQWFFNGTNLQFTERMKLSPDHRSLTIDPVKREDAGYYQCKVPNPISFVKSVPLELDVKFE